MAVENPPAFPFSYSTGVEHGALSITVAHGMTMADWFAGMALSPMLVQAYGATPNVLAKRAYEIAEAMMIERQKWVK